MTDEGNRNESDAGHVARTYIELLAAHKVDAAAAMWAPDGVDSLVGIDVLVGPDQVREYFTNFMRAIPDLEAEIISITAQGDRAAVHWRMQGTFNGTGKLLGVAPNGRRFDVLGTDLITVRGGRIVRNVALMNGMAFAREIALLPPAESRTERALFGVVNLTAPIARAIRARRSRRTEPRRTT